VSCRSNLASRLYHITKRYQVLKGYGRERKEDASISDVQGSKARAGRVDCRFEKGKEEREEESRGKKEGE